MRVLCLNCGSSSLKFSIRAVDQPATSLVIADGDIEGVGRPSSVGRLTTNQRVFEEELEAATPAEALTKALGMLRQEGLLAGIDAVGHRVVHGGRDFASPVVVDDAVLRGIENVSELAPLHNEPALTAIRAARQSIPHEVTHVAVFDTAFYADLPRRATAYAMPREMAEKYGIRRYGFHGLAHRYMLEKVLAASSNRDSARIVSLQLGSGCSATASIGGRPVDTSMGFTPLEGLVMGTRSGDIDPAIPLFLAEKEGLSAGAVESLLNRRSGLLALSGLSADMRQIEAAAAAGNPDAAFAIELFCYRITKYAGAFAAALSGIDAVLFGGGIGEHSPLVRARVCESLSWLGLQLDASANDALQSVSRISLPGSPIEAWVIPVDEEDLIARDVFSTLSPARPA
jgi:acetate kinase